MRYGVGLGERNRDHVFLGVLTRFVHRHGDISGFPRTDSHLSFPVSDDHGNRERKAAATSDHARDTAHIDVFLVKFLPRTVTAPASTTALAVLSARSATLSSTPSVS